MGMAVKVRMLLAARQMTLKDLGARMDPPTSAQNIGRKIKNDNLTERDLSAIAQSSPGAIAVNAAILVGYRIAGIPGALVTICGTILPPLIILSIISVIYGWFRSNPWVAALLKGMQSGVAAVIADVTIRMAGDVIRQKKLLYILIMAGAFCATFFLKINVVYIILSCVLLGVIAALLAKRREAKAP